MVLQDGAKAPDFTATDTDGNSISLSDFKGSKLVLYFSNGGGVGCKSQSCGFRDAEARFAALDAKIVAVAAQNDSASKAFKESNRLTFPVISDKAGTLQKVYDVPATIGLIPGRVTYVIDREGIIQKSYNAQFDVSSHIPIAREALENIQ